jgi:hypothetical protein
MALRERKNDEDYTKSPLNSDFYLICNHSCEGILGNTSPKMYTFSPNCIVNLIELEQYINKRT